MITIKSTMIFDFRGLEPEIVTAYLRLADHQEAKAKAAGIFWSRKESATCVAITTQQYLDIKKREDSDELHAVSVPERSH